MNQQKSAHSRKFSTLGSSVLPLLRICKPLVKWCPLGFNENVDSTQKSSYTPFTNYKLTSSIAHLRKDLYHQQWRCKFCQTTYGLKVGNREKPFLHNRKCQVNTTPAAVNLGHHNPREQASKPEPLSRTVKALW